MLALAALPDQVGALGLQRAEVALDWALGLEQVGLDDDAARYYARTAELTRQWLADNAADRTSTRRRWRPRTWPSRWPSSARTPRPRPWRAA